MMTIFYLIGTIISLITLCLLIFLSLYFIEQIMIKIMLKQMFTKPRNNNSILVNSLSRIIAFPCLMIFIVYYYYTFIIQFLFILIELFNR